MNKRAILALFFLCAAAAAVAFQLSVAELPPPFQTPSSNNRPQVVPQPQGAQVQAPPGFRVEVFAEGFQRPRFMLQGPGREIILTDAVNEPGGSVYVLRDADGDFRADSKEQIIRNLDRPYGLALWKDYLYVGEPASIKRYKYDSKNMKVSGSGEEVISLAGFSKGHWTRSLLFDRKGSKLYVGVGSQSNADAGEDPKRAAINRYNADGSGQEIYASGTRNPIALMWYPGSDQLWAAVQERDQLGDDLVPDYFTGIKQGGFYGWPFAYVGPHEDPRRKGEAPDKVKQTIVPDVLLGSHVAVLDGLFYTGKQFPQEYHRGAFLANHGSWNRSQRVGYNVVFIPFKNGRPASKPRDFLTGFMLSPDKREVWGRPVALLQLTDGSLLLSDDGGNKLWRISYRR